jgi:signal transduction histidine kinase
MKLSAHYNKASIIITAVVLHCGALIYYFAINYIALKQLDRDLSEEVSEVIAYINLNGKLPKPVDFDEDQTKFVQTNLANFQTRFFDTVYNNPKEKNTEPGRAVRVLIPLKGKRYLTTITLSKEGTEFLVQIIALITLLLLAGLLIIIFLTNRYVLGGLWKPFYATLNELKDFNLSDQKDLLLTANKVEEFNELNEAVSSMASRVKTDYLHLQQFTENASHEMMTPLAVITSKLDTLIQDESLKNEQFEQINDIYAATGKLSRLNQSLLLLVKIENNLVDDADLLSLKELITQKTRQFNELILTKDIQVSHYMAEKYVTASKYLTDILLNNLFSNAIRHNAYPGLIIITLTANKLIFQNTGGEKALNGDIVFERFQKGRKSEGTGLGLTIVKNICKLYNWDITYSFENSFHNFEISFR